MKHIVLFFFLSIPFHAYSQKDSIDSRKVFFFIFDSATVATERVAKMLKRNTDTIMVKTIILVLEKENGSSDTVNCRYNYNIIFFKKIDTLNEAVRKIYMSVTFNTPESTKLFEEKLLFPYKEIYDQTNSTSSISVIFRRVRNNFYEIAILKTDYPFIIATFSLSSEIIGLYSKSNRLRE